MLRSASMAGSECRHEPEPPLDDVVVDNRRYRVGLAKRGHALGHADELGGVRELVNQQPLEEFADSRLPGVARIAFPDARHRHHRERRRTGCRRPMCWRWRASPCDGRLAGGSARRETPKTPAPARRPSTGERRSAPVRAGWRDRETDARRSARRRAPATAVDPERDPARRVESSTSRSALPAASGGPVQAADNPARCSMAACRPIPCLSRRSSFGTPRAKADRRGAAA